MKTFSLPNGLTACIVLYNDQWERGLNFVTPGDFFVQAGTWWYGKDKELQRHIHKTCTRVANKTQESIYIRKGSLRVDLYDEDLSILHEFVLSQGDFAVFAHGGHGYHILEDDTQVLEIKNGPFVGIEQDKLKF